MLKAYTPPVINAAYYNAKIRTCERSIENATRSEQVERALKNILQYVALRNALAV